MALACKIKGHKWDHCKCQRCGEQRNENHKWNHCTCEVCGKTRDADHRWNHCVCSVCGQQRNEDHVWKRDAKACEERCTVCGKARSSHTWKPVTDCLHVCKTCGSKEVHHAAGEWLAVGYHEGYGYDYNEYTCARCGRMFRDYQLARLNPGEDTGIGTAGFLDPKDKEDYDNFTP